MRAVDLFLPCAGGVEPLLADEARRLTGGHAEPVRGGVFVRGAELEAMELNLESRLAQRVLWPLVGAPYRDEHQLYAMAREVPWDQWIAPDQTLRVDVNAHGSPLQSINFAALRVKDAVCDGLRATTGERPSVDRERPDLPLVLFLGPDHATLYADTTGEALFKRGWRDARGGREDVKGEAPLRETLAAAMLAAAGWQGRAEDGPLFDPCCGAGTIAIEAAQIACGIAPGAQRHFAFERMRHFRNSMAAWRDLQRAARVRQHPSAVPIFAGDISFRMTELATRNAERAGVARAIEFKTADVLQRPPPAPHGVLMMNPPYGERIDVRGTGTRAVRESLGGAQAGEAFFANLAAHWKRHYAGWTAWILSPDMKLPSRLRLKEGRRVPMWNGPIECRLFRFDLVAGSARPPAGDGAPAAAGPR
jgi:putative N6-adenine-specific DNA methylase